MLFKLVRGPFPLFYNKRKGPLYTIEQGATRNETKDSFVLGFTKWPSNQYKLLGRTDRRTESSKPIVPVPLHGRGLIIYRSIRHILDPLSLVSFGIFAGI